VYLGAPALPERWADSDSALQAAEKIGGSQFRANNPGAQIQMELYTHEDDSARWEVVYQIGDSLWYTQIIYTTDVAQKESIPLIPDDFKLAQNFPNPFNGETVIQYDLPVRSRVIIQLYNMRGQEVDRLVDKWQSAGSYSASWDGGNQASGIYYYRLRVEGEKPFSDVKKMLLVR
jgi:hypothetical protein